MKKATISLLIIVITIGWAIIYFKQNARQLEPKNFIAKYAFGKQGKGLGEFEGIAKLCLKENYLW